MAEPILYIDRSSIRAGSRAEIQDRIGELVAFIEENEPQLAGYQFFFDGAGEQMTVVAIHPDSESLVTHMEVGRSAFEGFADLIELEAIEVYGRPGDDVMALLEDKAAMLGRHATVRVHDLQDGFMRIP